VNAAPAHPAGASRPWAGVAAFAFTAAVLVVARLKAPFAILLADRFLPGTGWAQIALLAAYAGVLAMRLCSRPRDTRYRLWTWLAFSIVFFSQLLLGAAGIRKLLMTGVLHLPVPAVVIAGPIYRGGRLFMPILFVSTLLLVGPAWCSHLCYFGAWDALAASARRRAGRLAPAWSWLRVALFAATPLAAWLLRITGVGAQAAALAAIGFGAIGLALMAGFSTRNGAMVHCTGYCPLGLAAVLLGRLSAFRLRIHRRCDGCGKCIPACRYNALDAARIRARRPGYSCTLCGDCLGACPRQALEFRFPGLTAAGARSLFLVLAASLHAVFLGLARV
jgi:polyferredoxin